MKICGFLVGCLISLFSGIVASEHCLPSDNESVLQINNVYTYHYRSVALAQAVGTTQDQGKFVLECDVRISHERKCYYNLELQDCSITATGGEPGFESPWVDRKPLPELSRYHVMFSLVNGEIKEVKAHEDDPVYNVNIKRGVLSAFVFKLSQTTQELDEMHVDVHGTCPFKSVPSKDAEGDVKAWKDMLHCQFPSKPDWQFSPWSLFWNMSFIQHVINSTTNCSYKVNSEQKRMERVFCHERHAIMLESTHRTTTAVQTNVFYYMDFVNSATQNSKPALVDLTRTTDIRYEYEDTPEPTRSPGDFLRTAVKMLSDLVLDSVDEIRLFTIPQFTDLVAWIRASHDLTALVNKVKYCEFLPDDKPCDDRMKELALSYLSDALVQCNTVPCAKAITYLATNDDLSPTYLHFIYNTWSYMYYSKPGFLTNFMNLCEAKASPQCWMSLGSFARRTCSRENTLEERVLQEVKEVAGAFHKHIEEECEVTSDAENEQYTNCLAFLKAASNLGKYYTKLVPDGVSRLLEHATNDHSPTFVRVSAIEAIQEVYNAENREQSREIYDELLPLMKNPSVPASVQILSYDQLMLVASEESHFEEYLVGILKEETNSELKYYVADNLNSLIADRQFRAKHEKFLDSLVELLQENQISLETILYLTKGKSRSSSNSFFLNSQFFPDSMRKFGLKVAESRLFDAHIYPTIMNQETVMQLFSNLIPTSKLGSYFEGWEEVLLTFKKNLVDVDAKSTSFPKFYEAVMKTFNDYRSKKEDANLHFIDGNIIANIKEIHRLYWQHHKKLNPYAKAYLDLFGSTIKYMIQDNFQNFQKSTENQDLVSLLGFLGKDLEDGVTYNVTRVIRVIEAYHQVPTMMGLPLNWTTNATLAFSMKAGFKYHLNSADNKMHSKGFFQPSAALTFLNRMVLDYPTLTQIGVQANSSGYTSTELRLQYDSAKGKQTLRLQRPSKTQKILELFRTNQLIKHNNYNDIPDWDIERTSSSWCTKGGANSVAGLQFCFSKSYPNVTHRIKPWALMAGRCKWQFLVHPADQNDVYYDMQLQQTPKQKSKEYAAKFSIIEKDKENAAHFKVVVDDNEKRMELRSSLLPDFIASFKTDVTENKNACGRKIEALLQLFKDFKYEVEYTVEAKTQKPQSASVKGSKPSQEDSQILLSEEKFHLITPYSIYKGNKTILKAEENTKAVASLQYENVNSKSNWMKMVLPPEFWVDEKKASIDILLHWKKPLYDDETETRSTEFRLNVPHFTMTLLGDSLKMNDRQQISVKLAKMNHKYQKLEAFMNFTYDWWASEIIHEVYRNIHQVNITIPRRSWSAKFQSAIEVKLPVNGMAFKYGVELKRILMKAKQEPFRNYVGWWNAEVSDHFTVDEKKADFSVEFGEPGWSNEEMTNKYFSTLAEEDAKEFAHSSNVFKVALHYPLSDRTESLLLDGYVLMSRNNLERRLHRFQKTLNLTSSYNNLLLTSDSVYKSSPDFTHLYHHSYFTHLPSQTKAFHTILYTKKYPTDQCELITFNHDIRSHVFDLSTDASYKCEPENDDLKTFLLKINTNSSKWDMLNMTLDQIIQDISPDYKREEVVARHQLGTIHVDAEWHGRHQRDHQKRVVVCSEKGNCPNAEFLLETFHYGKTKMKLSLPNQNNSQISFEADMSSDNKNLHIKLGHSNTESDTADFFDFTGEIVDENFQVWKGMVDMKTLQKVEDLILPAYQSTCEAVANVAKNASHPLNDILQPALKMTLYDWWKSVETEAQNIWSVSWQEIKDVFFSLEAFTESAYAVLCNSMAVVNNQFKVVYNAVKDKSITIWAVNYFHLPHYCQKAFANLPHGVWELVQQLSLHEERVLNFKYFTGKIMSLRAFNEWPSFSFYPLRWLKNVFYSESKTETTMPRPLLKEGEKLGVIFGPLHVYTFDGLVYDVPAYPHKECSYLLAHDVHKSLFTVFSSQESISVLFPEMSIVVDGENRVFVNGSQKASALPIQAANRKVTIERGQDLVQIWSPSLTIMCSSRHFLCLLKLREFHSGGVIGLLGNADDYIHNDFMLPRGNVSSNLVEFVKSYEISGQPECQNLAPAPVSDDEPQSCRDEFSHACFFGWDSRKQFMRACVSDFKAGHDPCYTAAGLSAVCSVKNRPSYTKCSVKKQESRNIRRRLEVVLVVQESKHLTSADSVNAPAKGIESLARAIDTHFRESGYDSVKFSVVGYGGSGVHYAPSVHSAGKEVWLPVEDMIKDVLGTLEFKSKDDANAVEALRYALNELGYDTFDSKLFIVISAKDRQVDDKSLTDNLKEQLEENGITLYTLSSYPSIEKGKKVYGVRTDGLIFPSDTGDSYLDYPRGSLAKLTSSTRGSLFLSKFLRDNKPASFFAEVVQEMWAKVNKESQKCRSCTSVPGGWWWYRNVCTITEC